MTPVQRGPACPFEGCRGWTVLFRSGQKIIGTCRSWRAENNPPLADAPSFFVRAKFGPFATSLSRRVAGMVGEGGGFARGMCSRLSVC